VLTLVLTESALETIPQSLWKHPLVKRHAKKRRKHPRFLLLDRSYHDAAMKSLRDSEKRGRPDIVHFALLEALGTPLNKEGYLRIYVHTINDHVVQVNPEVRLPKNYTRFVGLFEQLFQLRRIPPAGPALLLLERKNLDQLLQDNECDYVLAFSTKGSRGKLDETMQKLQARERPTVLIGGFAHGHFSETTAKLADEIVCVDPEMLEAGVVTSRVIYDYERAISLPTKRLNQ
jgi:rRNA small subunit pseudouridine methyltransferase Nep1